MKKSAISVYTLVFGLILILLLGGLLNFLLSEIKITNQKIAREQAFNIAETGIFYYLWCQNNQVSCPLQKDYEDFSGKIIGKFQLEVEREMNCGIEGTHKVTSIGWTLKYPQIKRKISVIFGRESIAKFSFLLNSDVWVGQDVIIFGPYHSNGGVRFDGKNLSLVSSSKEKWVCTKNFGCGPEGQGYGLGLCPPECQIIEKQCICPGVFSTTKNSNRDLFSFPVPNFDFLGLTLDLAEMKQKAQNYGIYLPPSHNINSNGKGWHLIFREDGTLEARIITQLNCISSYSLEEGAHIDCFTISKEISYRTFQIPADCGLIFVEDNIWPEGKIKGKVTLASANLIDPNLDTSAILQNNIDYTRLDGKDAFLLIAEKNILLGPNSPDNMLLRGIFVAQKGRFSRNHYQGNIKNTLKIFGSIISNGRVGTQWINLGGRILSGYLQREIYIDENLIYSPPPFTPVLDQNFKTILWEEI